MIANRPVVPWFRSGGLLPAGGGALPTARIDLIGAFPEGHFRMAHSRR